MAKTVQSKQAQQEKNLEILQRGEKIDKELFFTKESYENLVTGTWPLVNKMRKNLVQFHSSMPTDLPVDTPSVADTSVNTENVFSSILYGLYYYSFTGLVRSGPLCERVMGKNGFPEISVFVGENCYFMQESILNTLFGNVAESIISPWKDAWHGSQYSYVEDITEGNAVGPSGAGSDIKVLQKKYNDDILSLKKQNAENIKRKEEEKQTALKAQKEKYDAEISNLKLHAGSSGDIDAMAAIESAKAAEIKLKTMTLQHQKEMQTLKSTYQAKVDSMYEQYKASLNKKNQNISNLQFSLREKTSGYDEYRQKAEKAEKELEEHKKYVYDPNYDHYYSDVLPKLVNAIEFTHTDIIIRMALIALSMAGIVLSFVYFI